MEDERRALEKLVEAMEKIIKPERREEGGEGKEHTTPSEEKAG